MIICLRLERLAGDSGRVFVAWAPFAGHAVTQSASRFLFSNVDGSCGHDGEGHLLSAHQYDGGVLVPLLIVVGCWTR